MKNFTLKFFMLCAIISFSTQAQNDNERCGFVETEHKLQEKNPYRLNNEQFENWIAPKIEQIKNERSSNPSERAVITIPVVVHVIHNGDDYGVDENITDSQIQSQLTVLIEDFRRLAGTPGYNDNPVGADLEIEFVLAKQTPDGCPTNGINRVNMGQESWSTADIDDIVKPATIWDPTQYMNMWSITFTRSDLLGYAQFPSNSQLDGLDEYEGDADTDGVVCSYDAFGSEDYDDGTFTLQTTYNKGRTMTHEVGHFLGLRHIWGDGGCDVDDYVEDTPLAGKSNNGCPVIDTCPEETGSEVIYDMVQNYMDYTNDECMNIFTEGQKARVLAVLENSPRRKGLVTSDKANEPEAVDNDPSISLIEMNIPACGSEVLATVKITNYGTTPLNSLVLTSTISDGTTSNYNWTGNLASGESEIVTIPAITVTSIDFTYTVSISTPNGQTDARTCNNTISESLQMTTIFASTSVINFNLKTDLEGSETTWQFLNSNNEVIEEGGGNYFGNLSISKSFEVSSDECYTFVIYDAGGNGICCSNGEGYYTLSTDDGTIIYSGGEFSSEDRINISTKTLGVSDKEYAAGISLYPNPTKDVLNVKLSNSSELPSQYQIYNMLGQVVKQKQINATTDLSISTRELQNGMYFIKLTNSSNSVSLRFIKN
ncbi:T9SS type A sorting domain-containing protein [Formosa sediminum]|uniref:T9SS type A sorting domain-containing protein n=1 Tax=Formosa sediminum TaxID=2594004 RepID=A0A516GP89_9FLAO|nr:T9SS type A sorting domain-containing protein [Formosa sediminum]QDO93344.1 T9SS type A sorting domain-containing protein [Formosa sediminum]